MPFEEYAPSKPPSANAVGRDEVMITVQTMPARGAKKHAGADRKMMTVTIGVGLVRQLGWMGPQMRHPDAPAAELEVKTARVLFGGGVDLGKLQIARGSSVSYKLRAMRGGAVKLRVTAFPPGAPAVEVQRKTVAAEVIRPAGGSEAYLLVTLPAGLVRAPAEHGLKRVRA